MPGHQDFTTAARSTPVQRRAQERVDALLDAAAQIIEEVGIVGMTTSLVAERSGSSVGVVYRYFPNVHALLVALAARNRAKYEELIATALERGDAPDWRSFALICIDRYGLLAQSEPAFRAIRFGDVVVSRFAEPTLTSHEMLAAELDAILVSQYGFELTDDLVFATQLTMEYVDAAVRRAFLHEPAGDARFLDAAREIAIATLETRAPAASGSDVVSATR